LFFIFWHIAKLRNPRPRRAPPELPPRRQLVTLAQRADAQSILIAPQAQAPSTFITPPPSHGLR
jgi:hypothetical protein